MAGLLAGLLEKPAHESLWHGRTPDRLPALPKDLSYKDTRLLQPCKLHGPGNLSGKEYVLPRFRRLSGIQKKLPRRISPCGAADRL
ncbi:hypothetical protein DESPIG_00979 [Desulfovibrio piger ATCC 29098]|uniref:Uncharacterized protein n=1 Tax=Desulfovibrio piger ATCC 29098 TaxID=411464 RepID=B6WSJ0_9BACT|nr:hypothetical protein DESPIG_00979 [Desulfovibrio piger ATCC 29098]